jgi:predicted nucleotidyltransferase
VTRLALFGSTARNTATSGSDVDVLVAFDGPATSKRYFGVQFYLEDLLGGPVDLVVSRPGIPVGASSILFLESTIVALRGLSFPT